MQHVTQCIIGLAFCQNKCIFLETAPAETLVTGLNIINKVFQYCLPPLTSCYCSSTTIVTLTPGLASFLCMWVFIWLSVCWYNNPLSTRLNGVLEGFMWGINCRVCSVSMCRITVPCTGGDKSPPGIIEQDRSELHLVHFLLVHCCVEKKRSTVKQTL